MNNFQWIKVYQEICKALLHYKEDQKKLLEILWSCGVDKQFDKKVENGKEIKVDFEEVDPFTVLALISYKTQRDSGAKRDTVLKNLFKEFEKNSKIAISTDIKKLIADLNMNDQNITPPNPNNSWYFPFKEKLKGEEFKSRREGHINIIWNFFEKLVNKETISQEEFQEILSLEQIAITMLSIALSWIDPHTYIHWSHKVKKKYPLNPKNDHEWGPYQKLLDQLKKEYGDQPMYQIQALIQNDDQSNNTDSNNSNSIKVPHPLNQILYGPAGTGKTYHTINHALAILDGRSIEEEQSEEDRRTFKEYLDEGRIKFVTFHQSYGYEEFVEGIRVETIQEDPENNSSKKILNYDVKAGIFKNICDDARNNKDSNYVLIIDEINRGNISKIFGELITLIEDSKREGNNEALPVTLPYSGESFSVPGNLYIIGTMNSSDRSLTSLDLALRRRFEFIEMLPDPKVLKDITIGNISVKELLEIINKRIKALLDQDHCIGHANFTHLTSSSKVQDLMNVFEKKIIPLLQEYFFNDWEKINLVLGNNGMIVNDKIDADLFPSMDSNQIDRLNSRSWKINTDIFKDFQKSKDALSKIIGEPKTSKEKTEIQDVDA